MRAARGMCAGGSGFFWQQEAEAAGWQRAGKDCLLVEEERCDEMRDACCMGKRSERNGMWLDSIHLSFLSCKHHVKRMSWALRVQYYILMR